MIDTMIDLGMEPVITLSHYETPLALIADLLLGILENYVKKRGVSQ